ncbi:MAG: DUF2179 domain-containing protein [Vallitaleaceae bacterium]|jgi:uncharacterized protein YebE (UPF0316 family)|nr:DUF2179 domain-containing protein [Vallitaleaceae bacterium]
MPKLLLILLVQLCYVPMLTLRTISMVKSLKVLTAIFGFLEAVVYIFGIAIVLSGEQSLIEMVVYATGFSMGLVAGIFIEQKLALGYSSLQVNINHENTILINELRETGYGVTAYIGEGYNGNRLRLDILTKRNREDELVKTVIRHEPDAFIISYEPKMFRGGYLGKIIKRKLKLKANRPLMEGDKVNFWKKPLAEFKEEIRLLKKDWKR